MAMIGDAFAAGKRGSTTAPGPEFKRKNGKGNGIKSGGGRSFKTVDPSEGDSGGDAEQHAVAKRSTKGMRVGTGLPVGPGPKPFAKKKNGASTGDPENGQGYKTIASRGKGDSGNAIEAWVGGKRKTYK